MRELAFGVIGAGFWGEFQIAAWGEVAGARLVAVCDRNRARAAEVAARFGIPRQYGDAEEMVRSEALDFLDVVVGPEAHPQFVLLAARHGLHVICQKPMAPDYPTCLRMVETCRNAGTMFLVHENYRWQAPMRRVKELLDAGRIGRPFRAHLQFGHGDLSFFERQPYLFTQPHFALYDMGPHLLDLPRWFFGEPCRVFAHEFRMHPRFAGEDIVSIILEYERLTCHCELSWRTSGYEVFIEGDAGTITWHPDGRLVVTTNAGETVERLTAQPYPWADPQYGFAHSSIVATNQNLLAALRGEGQAETTGEDNLKTMWLLHLALESAQRHQSLAVSER
jgi:predicted dehydrogenase